MGELVVFWKTDGTILKKHIGHIDENIVRDLLALKPKTYSWTNNALDFPSGDKGTKVKSGRMKVDAFQFCGGMVR